MRAHDLTGGVLSLDRWQVLIGVLGLIVNGVGLAFVAVQVALARRQAREAQYQLQAERERLKKQSTIEFAMTTLDVRNAFRSQLPDDYDKQGIETLIRSCIADSHLQSQKMVAQYLGYMESFAVAISSGIHDLETADSLFGSRIIVIFENYREYIDHRRRADGRNYFCRELEWLHRALNDFREEGHGYDEKGMYIPFALRYP